MKPLVAKTLPFYFFFAGIFKMPAFLELQTNMLAF